MITFTIPIRVISEANQREHWGARYERKQVQQEATRVCLIQAMHKRKIVFPCAVTLTRIGAKPLDTDNLAGSFKHVQDAIAGYFQINDGNPTIKYEYAQEPNGKRDYSVRVEIREV